MTSHMDLRPPGRKVLAALGLKVRSHKFWLSLVNSFFSLLLSQLCYNVESWVELSCWGSWCSVLLFTLRYIRLPGPLFLSRRSDSSEYPATFLSPLASTGFHFESWVYHQVSFSMSGKNRVVGRLGLGLKNCHVYTTVCITS